MCELSEFDHLRAMRARNYLASVRAAKARLSRQRDRRAEQLEQMGLKAIIYTGMPGSPNSYGDAIPDGVAKLDSVNDSISVAMADWEEMLAQAMQSLYSMPDPDYSELLERRYIDGEIWGAVANALGRSVSWCQYSKVPALIQLYDTMPSEYRIPRVPAL